MRLYTQLEKTAPSALGEGRRDGAPKGKPHICFVAPTTWPILAGDRSIQLAGGAEVQQSVIAPELAKRGYRVSMISLDYGQEEGAVAQGITVHKTCKPDAGIPVLRFVHPRLTSLWSALKRVDADIYYQRTAAATTGFVAYFCKRHGKRSIYAGASDVDFVPDRQEIAYSRDKRIFEFGVRTVSRIVAQNANQQELLRRHFGREAIVIPNCYAPKAEGRADRAGYVLWVATVRPGKRPEVLLEMARRLPQYRFVLIGGPDPGRRAEEYFESIRAAAAALPNVEVTGFIAFEDAERFFDGARAVVNTSLVEGFPNTFLQAWARGVPTLAFVDTGSRHDGKPVYDVVEDDAAQAASRLERLMGDDVHWAQASKRVLAHFNQRHSVDAIIDRYEREVFEWRQER